jgi:uncharacterized integral membrane protein (TIGR00698 family)
MRNITIYANDVRFHNCFTELKESLMDRIKEVLPGLALCSLVTAAAYALEGIETVLLGRVWLENLVLAILLGAAIRTVRPPSARFTPGIHLGAKLLLEIAVVLLGASIGAGTLFANGPGTLAGIACVVVAAIVLSYTIGRAFGLQRKMALLIACGNSICGNSAIAAVAPVIDADGRDVAAAIAFTAVLGVLVVLGLPLLAGPLSLSPAQFGMFAGLTVYAVPQVLAAAAPAGLASVQMGTVVKLVRVLMLGPTVLVLSLLGRGKGTRRPPLAQMVPWFIAGFLALLALRSCGWLPAAAIAPAHALANVCTIMSMAALGLECDARAVVRAGGRVAAVVVLSLLGLAAISLLLIRLLGVA